MLKSFVLTGDTHGAFAERLIKIKEYGGYDPKETAVIVLGDACVNYYLDSKDEKIKNELQESGFTFYFLRGNHEARPTDIKDIQIVYDGEVNNEVYFQLRWPNIRYFMDGEIYNIKGYSVLTIGGAYSVDKYYRLQRGWKWFENEQLSPEEREFIKARIAGLSIDFVLTHTCPISYEPRDLFLPQIDQSSVDKTTELWLDDIMDTFDWYIWLWGHYHSDRLVRPNMEMFYTNYDEIDDIYNRHKNMDYNHYRCKDPKFYVNDCKYGYRLKEEN